MGWAEQEWAAADLGDERLPRRLVKVAQQLADKPSRSIPTSCGGWADTIGAYRLLSNDRVDWRAVPEPHVHATLQRMAPEPVVLCLQDTTELDFNGQTITGLGPLSYEAQRGMYLHPTYAVSPQREPLGMLDAWMWAREPKDAQGNRGGIVEGVRWIEGYERLAERAPQLPATRLVQVGDRESDMLELMQRAQALGWPVDLLVRSRHNRVLPGGQHLWEQVQASDSVGEIAFSMGARPGQSARAVKQHIRIKRMNLATAGEAPLMMSCVIASEVDVPDGHKPVCWRLLTNRDLTTLAEAIELIDWYRARWEIEIFFHVLKTGCRVEALQLASMQRIERALAVFMVVSWRIAYLMRMGRTCPDLGAELFFDQDEISAAYVLTKKPPPKAPPRLNEAIRRIAMLGGFLARTGDGEPGVKTIWIGLQRVMDCATGLRLMREQDIDETCV
jgi:hypothetical protein